MLARLRWWFAPGVHTQPRHTLTYWSHLGVLVRALWGDSAIVDYEWRRIEIG